MVIVKKLTAKLQIELTAEFFDTFPDISGLYGHIFFAIKTDLHSQPHMQKTSFSIIPHIYIGCKVFLKNTTFLFFHLLNDVSGVLK